jgi:hydrophobe/amphiphile efflux-1 (HAE1) family protein
VNLSTWAIHKPIPSILLFIMITVAGLVAFRGLGVQGFPDVDVPTVSVTASLPGAPPSQLETEVARPIEDAIASVGAVKHVSTNISDGLVSMIVEFSYEKNPQEAQLDVRDAVTRIRSTLPAELQEPIVTRVTSTGLPILTYAVSGQDIDEADLSWFIDDSVAKTLLPIRGVAQVTRQGGVTREVRVELDPVRLQALRVTAGEISSQLRSMQQEAPGGRGEIGGLEQSVRMQGTASDAEQLAALSLPLADGRRVRLSDVATVRDTHAERRQLALLDGQPVVGFQIYRARGFDEVGTARGVREAVAKLMQDHPRIRLVEVNNTVDVSQADYDASMRALYEGAVLAVLVVWLFLRDWRATLVSAVALPLSIIPTFLVIAMLGYTLNIITLLALTLVIGILVDDAIVEVENIMRHLRMGKPPLQAAMEAAEEIGLAVVATSLTLVAVFLPTAFTGGITGAFFRQFGWTASAAVLFSLLVARLLTPMMAAYLLKPPKHEDIDGPVMLNYLKAVRWCLAHPRWTCAGTAAFFVASILMIGNLPSGFIAPKTTESVFVTLQGPPGNTLEQTTAIAEQARRILAQAPEIARVYTAVGAGMSTGDPREATAGAVRNAQLTATLTRDTKTHRPRGEMEAALRESLAVLPGVRVSIGQGAPGEKMPLVLTSDDPVLLQKTARFVESELRTIPAGAVTSSASLQRPEILIQPDFDRAAALGVTSAAIAQAVRVATTGDYDFNLSRLNLPGRQVYVRVQLDPQSRADPETVAQLRVRGADGAGVPLGNIADIRTTDGLAQIDRYDRQRSVKLAVDLQGLPLGDVQKAADALPSVKNLPAGVKQVVSGDIESMQQMFSGFLLAMVAGVFCVYAVMVLLFHDFSQPLTVLAALPLAAGGALGLLWVFDFALSMATLIGLLMLIGIVTKNSILLVEYAIVARRDHGMSRFDALVDACHKRARPIVMTTVAMAAGMMPIALGLEGDNTFRMPMAVVVIGGLITSTALSLLVVPVVFEIVDDMRLWFTRRLGPKPQSNMARAWDQR